MQTVLIFSQADSHANHTHLPENEKAKMMSAISGQKCLEQYEKLNRGGLWAKTFSALLIGTGDWFSMRCRLTWKLKATKYNRIYFQLVPKTLRIEETEFGLLPTIIASDIKVRGRSSQQYGIPEMARDGLLPTPKAREAPNSPSMESLAVQGLLPTPLSVSDVKGGCTRKDEKRQNDTLAHAMHKITGGMTGKTSQLNPLFVMEMMGFPPDWTLLPFGVESSPETHDNTQKDT